MRSVCEGIDDPLAPYRAIDRASPTGRAWVLANMVAGLDGTAAASGTVGALSSPTDARLFTRMRGLADVVLVGAQTVRQEKYGPIVLDDDLAASRRADGRPPPRLAIVSSSLDLDPSLPLFTKARPDDPPIVITTSRGDLTRLSSVPAEIVVAGEERVDIRAAIDALAARSLPIVLCEGGPTLLGQLVAADLLDEYCLTISPVIGGDPLPVVNTTDISGLRQFALHHVYIEENTLFLNYLRQARP
jgi:riboflavin biosynthesis pyrimidine reductase